MLAQQDGLWISLVSAPQHTTWDAGPPPQWLSGVFFLSWGWEWNKMFIHAYVFIFSRRLGWVDYLGFKVFGYGRICLVTNLNFCNWTGLPTFLLASSGSRLCVNTQIILAGQLHLKEWLRIHWAIKLAEQLSQEQNPITRLTYNINILNNYKWFKKYISSNHQCVLRDMVQHWRVG